MARKPATLPNAVAKSIRSAHWLTDSDAAAQSLAQHYAELIEDAVSSGDDELAAKVLGWHGPHLLNTLKALGCTPADRKALGAEREVKGRLGELRALRDAG